MTLTKYRTTGVPIMSRKIYKTLPYGYCGCDYTPSGFFSKFKPKADVWEDTNNFYFEFELPGVGKDDLKVNVDEDLVLTITGEKKDNFSGEGFDKKLRERLTGNFSRSFRLPDNADIQKITADYTDGILKVKVAKKSPDSKTIEIS